MMTYREISRITYNHGKWPDDDAMAICRQVADEFGIDVSDVVSIMSVYWHVTTHLVAVSGRRLDSFRNVIVDVPGIGTMAAYSSDDVMDQMSFNTACVNRKIIEDRKHRKENLKKMLERFDARGMNVRLVNMAKKINDNQKK